MNTTDREIDTQKERDTQSQNTLRRIYSMRTP